MKGLLLQPYAAGIWYVIFGVFLVIIFGINSGIAEESDSLMIPETSTIILTYEDGTSGTYVITNGRVTSSYVVKFPGSIREDSVIDPYPVTGMFEGTVTGTIIKGTWTQDSTYTNKYTYGTSKSCVATISTSDKTDSMIQLFPDGTFRIQDYNKGGYSDIDNAGDCAADGQTHIHNTNPPRTEPIIYTGTWAFGDTITSVPLFTGPSPEANPPSDSEVSSWKESQPGDQVSQTSPDSSLSSGEDTPVSLSEEFTRLEVLEDDNKKILGFLQNMEQEISEELGSISVSGKQDEIRALDLNIDEAERTAGKLETDYGVEQQKNIIASQSHSAGIDVNADRPASSITLTTADHAGILDTGASLTPTTDAYIVNRDSNNRYIDYLTEKKELAEDTLKRYDSLKKKYEQVTADISDIQEILTDIDATRKELMKITEDMK